MVFLALCFSLLLPFLLCVAVVVVWRGVQIERTCDMLHVCVCQPIISQCEQQAGRSIEMSVETEWMCYVCRRDNTNHYKTINDNSFFRRWREWDLPWASLHWFVCASASFRYLISIHLLATKRKRERMDWIRFATFECGFALRCRFVCVFYGWFGFCLCSLCRVAGARARPWHYSNPLSWCLGFGYLCSNGNDEFWVGGSSKHYA